MNNPNKIKHSNANRTIESKTKYNGLRPINIAVKTLTKDIFKKKGFKENLIFQEWSIIVGEKLAKYSIPERIISQTCLKVIVDPAYALEFQYKTEFITKRLQEIYGYKKFRKFIIKQQELEGKTSLDTTAIDSERHKETVFTELNKKDIFDNDLRKALNNLGRSIAKKT